MDSLKRLLEFLTEIERRKISYRLEPIRAEALMVLIAVPGQSSRLSFLVTARANSNALAHLLVSPLRPSTD